MVYSHLYIVYGIKLSVDEVCKIWNNNEKLEEDDFIGDILDLEKIPYFPFWCCSKSNNKYVIIGEKMHTYYKKKKEYCEECSEPFYCDKCVGFTNNGFYNVDEILNTSTPCDTKHICSYCFADNRGEFKECNTCGIEYKDNLLERDSEYNFQLHKTIGGLLRKHKIKPEFNLYYMIDDCLSCS